jgi:hypothetical protein
LSAASPLFWNGAGFFENGRNTMRVFVASCLVAAVIAVGAAVILDNFVQEPVSAAFAEQPSVRV